jgi:hypothetical protein
VACIGQAGECLVRFASVIVDKYSSAARGSGAVMGSKKFKGMVGQGNRQGALNAQCNVKIDSGFRLEIGPGKQAVPWNMNVFFV